MSDWRELARKNVPWEQWSAEEKEQALSDDLGARRRIDKNLKTAADYDTYKEDQEGFTLLRPYLPKVKLFFEMHTIIDLDTTPNPSSSGQSVTINASVRTLGGAISTGIVNFDISTGVTSLAGGGFQDGSRMKLGVKSLFGGKASMTTPALRVGIFGISASLPTTQHLVGSSAALVHTVK